MVDESSEIPVELGDQKDGPSKPINIPRLSLVKAQSDLESMLERHRIGSTIDPLDIEKVLSNPEVAKLIANDGTMTYLVHSAKPEDAEKIMETGLDVWGYTDPPKPDLWHSAFMLAGPSCPDQLARNTVLMAYRLLGRDVKTIFAIPEPNPNTWDHFDPDSKGFNLFEGTFLDQDGGKYVVRKPDGHARSRAWPYTVLPQYGFGGFNIGTGEFKYNPRFFANASK